MDPAQYAGLAAVGMFAGAVNAIAGGGTLLMFPALVATGMTTVEASVTNAVALWPGYVGNVISLGEPAREQARLRWRLAIFAIAGSLCGSGLLLVSSARAVDLIIPVLVFCASIVLALQPWLKRRFSGSADHDRKGLIAVCVFGVGVYGGFFQGALGVILLAVLGVAMVATLATVNALKGVLQVVIVSINVIIFAMFGPVHWLVAAIVAPASLIGGMIGGRFSRSVNEVVLRRCVVTFGVLVSIWLAVRALA